MANPLGTNQFLEKPKQYGDAVKEQALLRAAPISGAPAPPKPQTGVPAQGAGRAPVSRFASPQVATPAPPNPKADYYNQLAETWSALANIHGASDLVKDIAKQARTYAENVQTGQV